MLIAPGSGMGAFLMRLECALSASEHHLFAETEEEYTTRAREEAYKCLI